MTQDQHNEDYDLNIEGIPKEQLKRNSFQTPEGYFESLTPRIMESVRNAAAEEYKPQINWWRVLMPGLGFSAMVLAVWFFSNTPSNSTLSFEQVVASMTIEELDQFADFDTEDLLAYGVVESDELKIESSLTEDDIIDYLLEDEEMELNTIYEEIDI